MSRGNTEKANHPTRDCAHEPQNEVERELTIFVPVCSSVAVMHCMISRKSAVQERSTRWKKKARLRLGSESHRDRYTGIARPNSRVSCRPMRKPASSSRQSACLASRTYCGVADGIGDIASVAGDGIGEVASGAGNTAPPDIFDLGCLWLCNFSSACRLALSLSAFIFESSGTKARISAASCCILSLSACTCAGSGVSAWTAVEVVRAFAVAFSFSANAFTLLSNAFTFSSNVFSLSSNAFSRASSSVFR